jgi:hypothetical protein
MVVNERGTQAMKRLAMTTTTEVVLSTTTEE